MNEKATETSGRTRKLMLAAAGLLLILILGGVWLATWPYPAQQASPALPGAAITDMTFVDPPGWVDTDGEPNQYILQPVGLAGSAIYVRVFSKQWKGGSVPPTYPLILGKAETDLDRLSATWHLYRGDQPGTFMTLLLTGEDLTNFVMSSFNESADAGVQVVAIPEQDSDGQLWGFVEVGSGRYLVYNHNNDLCLELEGGGVADGVRVIQAACDVGRSSQLFGLIRTE